MKYTNEGQSNAGSNGLDPFAGWLTLAAVLAICFVTLFPFHFSVATTDFRRAGDFFGWFAPAAKKWKGWVLNGALFFPLGFGWSWWTRARNWPRLGNGVIVAAVGFCLSFAVEWLQLYLPTRSSSWDDVLMNTLGALMGWFVFRFLGAPSLRFVEGALEDLSAALER